MCVAGVNVSSIIGMFDVVVVLLVVSASGRESQSSPRILSSKPISSSDRGHAIAAAIDQSEGWLQFLLVALENLFDDVDQAGSFGRVRQLHGRGDGGGAELESQPFGLRYTV